MNATPLCCSPTSIFAERDLSDAHDLPDRVDRSKSDASMVACPRKDASICRVHAGFIAVPHGSPYVRTRKPRITGVAQIPGSAIALPSM